MTWLILLMLQKHAAPNAVPANVLAPAIIKTADKYNLDPVLLTQLILVESRGYAKALNRKSQDYGILQVNAKTAKAYGYTIECLLNLTCGLDAGARILADMQKHTHYRPCFYNLGPRKARLHVKTCAAYEQRLAIYD